MAERIVIDTGLSVALGKADTFSVLERLPPEFLCPSIVFEEYSVGWAQGHLQPAFPSWVSVLPTSQQTSASNLDPGEAAVVQLALEQSIRTVCLDDAKGRRFASQRGLQVTGSLGLLGRVKQLGMINEVRPFVDRLTEIGTWYDPKLLARFLAALGE